MKFILGSSSPRRLDILKQLNLKPDAIIAPDIDETPLKGELPRHYCTRITQKKCEAIAVREAITSGDIILVADTTVALGRRILGKPRHEDDARQFLTLLSGRRHKVYSAVAVQRYEQSSVALVVTSVKMKRLSELELNGYLATQDWKDKAGGYSIQGASAAFIPWISGSYSAVMGLPIVETAHLLQRAGMRLWA